MAATKYKYNNDIIVISDSSDNSSDEEVDIRKGVHSKYFY